MYFFAYAGHTYEFAFSSVTPWTAKNASIFAATVKSLHLGT